MMITGKTQLIDTLKEVFKDRLFMESIESSTQDEFYVEDNDELKRCVIINNKEGNNISMFHVVNPLSKTIFLWAIDGKFFAKGKGPSRCDGALFDDKEFCLFEFKFNATSNNPNTVLKNLQKGTEQLEKMVVFIINSISSSSSRSLLSSSFRIKEAYLSTPSFYPKNSNHIQSEKVRFLEEYGIMLFNTNEKNFELS